MRPILARFFGGAPGDIVGQMIGLEAGGEQFGRPAYHLAQFRLAQRRHLDLARYVLERLVVLQFAEEVRAQAHHRAQTRVGERLATISEKRRRWRASART